MRNFTLEVFTELWNSKDDGEKVRHISFSTTFFYEYLTIFCFVLLMSEYRGGNIMLFRR